MAWIGDSIGGHLTAILESGSSEEEDEEAAPGQHLALDPVADDTETRLAQLEQASQALLAELAALDPEVELELRCQQRAQTFSAQEDARLERISLAGTPEGTPGEVTAVMSPEVAPEEVTPTGVALEEPPAPAQLPAPQENLSELLEQHRDLGVQLQHLQAQLELEREEQQRLRAALASSHRALRSFKRVSQIVTQDYCQALEQLELEQDLRCHAEAFAHQMLVQQKEAKRQSSILLRSAAPDSQLLEALQELEKLHQELEETRREQRQQEKELEQEREELRRAREEKRELMERLEELEKEAGSLREQLAQRPPPPSHPEVPPAPPLPPPAATAVPADPLATLRQRKVRKNREQSDAGTEDIRARAVQEMLERIRSGIVLRPARARPPPCQDSTASKRRSAALELAGILGALRRPSRRRSRRSREQQPGSAPELGLVLERRRRALDASMGNSMGDSMGDSMGNSMGKSMSTNSMGNSMGTKSMGNPMVANSMGNHSKGTNSIGNSMGNSISTNSTCPNSAGTNSKGTNSTGNSMGNQSMENSMGNHSKGTNSMGTKSKGTNSMENSTGTNSMGNHSKCTNSMGNSKCPNSMGNSMGTNSVGNSMGNSMSTNSTGTNSMENPSKCPNSMGNSTGTDSTGANPARNSMSTDSVENSMSTDSTGTDPTRNSTGAWDGAGNVPGEGAEVTPAAATSCPLPVPSLPSLSWLFPGNRRQDTEKDMEKDMEKEQELAKVPFRPRGLGGLPRTRPRPRWAGDSGDKA